jgi:RNA polymerase-binding transcription factor DksA|tara:strand:+ start:283 stop:516 length:234 start_codon:yes stop_codon:yes gene_type:complete
MTISKDELQARKTELTTNAEKIQADIVTSENQTKTLRNNLNAMVGAIQQVDMFIKQIEEKGEPMPAEKQQALDMATS